MAALVKYHLCCGFDYRSGFVNVDDLEGGPQDVRANLNRPWSFAADASASHILIKDGLEHLDSIEAFLTEAARVLAPGGTLEIIMPHFRSPSAYRLTHRHLFSSRFFDVFPEPHDSVRSFRAVKNELVVERKLPLLDKLSNLAPKLGERVLHAAGVQRRARESRRAAVSVELPDTARRSDSPLSVGALDVATNLAPHIPRGQTVLEVGCGFGYLSALILNNENQLTALDISAVAIAECRNRFGDRATFVEADILTYRTEQRFAYAFINEVLDQIPDDVGALAAVFALLEPGGRLVLSTSTAEDRFIDASLHRYDEAEIRRKVESVGFRIATAASYGGALSHFAAVMSRRFKFSKRLLSALRRMPLYKQLVTMDAKLATRGDRIILVCEKT